jgi:hypothetical protein
VGVALIHADGQTWRNQQALFATVRTSLKVRVKSVNPCVGATNAPSPNAMDYASCEVRLNLICILFGFSLKNVFKMFSSLRILKCSFFCGVRDVSHGRCDVMTEQQTAKVIWNWKFVTWSEFGIDVRTVWYFTSFNVVSFRLRSRSFILWESRVCKFR